MNNVLTISHLYCKMGGMEYTIFLCDYLFLSVQSWGLIESILAHNWGSRLKYIFTEFDQLHLHSIMLLVISEIWLWNCVTAPVHFVLVLLEIRCYKLFGQADIEPQIWILPISASQVCSMMKGVSNQPQPQSFFCGTRICIQVLIFAKQALYILSHSKTCFMLGIFELRSY
jgi:hypothetical protein